MSDACERPPTKIFLPRRRQSALVTVYDEPVEAFGRFNEGHGVRFCDTPHEAEIVVLFEEWQTRFEDYAKTLSDDEFYRAYWDRIYTVNCDDLGRGFLPGCYTSLTPHTFDVRWHRPCAYPYRYNAELGDAADGHREWLFSFRGTDASHRVRTKMFRHLVGHHRGKMVLVRTQFHSHDPAQKQEFVSDIVSSAFVLCPRGWSPSTYRLFEVMEAGRCPVIISDDWLPIEGPDWDTCSIRIRESDVDTIPALLERRECDAAYLGRQARAAWETHFAEPQKFRAMCRAILSLHQMRDGSDYRARWHSREFRRANGWLLSQRLTARLQHEVTRRWGAH